jgi:uncharacterized protein YgiB involved in biofilm formation
MLRKLRRSSQVTLVLIGVASLAGCGRTEERHDVYKSREDCLADWGNKPEDCNPATQPSHAARGFWYGPTYYGHPGFFGSAWSSSGGGSHAIGSSGKSSGSSISRGGFGSSAHSSGG